MRIVALAAGLALAISTASHAQSPTTADPVKLALAQELVEASGGAKAAEQQINAVYSSLHTAFEGALPKEAAAIMASVQESMRKELIKSLPELIAVSVDVYANNLSESELRAYVAFLKSEPGRSIQAKAPAILQEATIKQGPLMRRMLPKLMHKALDDACAEKGCTAEQRQQIAALIKQIAPAT